MPSRNYLEVVYEDGFLTLLSNSYEGEFDVQLYNRGNGETICNHSIMIGSGFDINLDSGEYEVTAMNSDGSIFYGIMYIE